MNLIGRAVLDNFRYFARGRWRRASQPLPLKESPVPPDFFGICVASAPDEACDHYVIARLKELGISCVRVDFTYDSRHSFGERFLKRLLDESFRVCLHLVQPLAEVKAMADPQAQERWRSFVAETLDAHGARLEMVEIGSTCNRRQWSGYTPATFLLSWQIAWEEAQRHHIPLAGPNVTDFEPLYNIAILSELKRSGMLPAIHTDNLLVERATEPEAFDHKILGRRLAGTLRFNLVRKAQLLNDIGRWASVPATLCAHVSWSLRRIARVLDHVEEKQADYVTRYGCLAAASGALTRVYWGPLIGQREGLIDDGTSAYPSIPHVTFYGHAYGRIAHYRLRPAFRAFQTLHRIISGAVFCRKMPTGPGLEILEFTLQKRNLPFLECGSPAAALQTAKHGFAEDKAGASLPHSISKNGYPDAECIVHVVWTTNGNRAEASACYAPDVLKAAEAYSRDGDQMPHAPILFSESPVYLCWPAAVSERLAVSSEQQPLAACPTKSVTAGRSRVRGLPGIIPGVRFANLPGKTYAPIPPDGWEGFYLAEDAGTPIDLSAMTAILSKASDIDWDERHRRGRLTEPPSLPAARMGFHGLPDQAVLIRDGRNRVWSISAPWNRSQTLIVKQFKPRCFWKRLLQWRQPDRAQRSWNGAQELLRRGIPTPLPLAFFHRAHHPSRLAAHASYYVCQAFQNAWSVREAFTAFSRGATQFQGKSDTDLFEAIAQFVRNLHDRGVFFRDLSAGNLLFRCEAEADIEFALIDTTRARFTSNALGLRQRLCDLIRLCHPLHWKGREAFVGTYLQFIGRRFSLWMKIPFAYYDAKHWLKNAIKGIKRL